MEISQLNGNTLVDATFHEYINTVGAVIFSFNDSFSPSALWGGSWSRVTNRFLIGSGGSYALGSTGGAATHEHAAGNLAAAITINEDEHGSYVQIRRSGLSFLTNYETTAIAATIRQAEYNVGGTMIYGNTGESLVLPPYIAVNIWRKVA